MPLSCLLVFFCLLLVVSVDSVSFTHAKRYCSLCTVRHSDLHMCHEQQHRHIDICIWSCSLVLRSQMVDSKDVCILPSASDADIATEAVVHLVIQRPAKVGWHVAHDSNFELSITRHDTADTLKKKLETRHGLPADSHRLLYNGKPVPCSKPLLQYGIDKGSVLELAPFEPSPPSSLPGTSPKLSSPEHELFEGWQKARAGLAKGIAPKLAAAGTGG